LNDLKEGHITLPLIIAMERDRELREYIKSVVGKETIDFDKEYIVSSVKRHIDITYEYLDRWHKRGIEIIERFSDNIYTNLLYELFKFIREREY
jgi:geranylgeranyl pyrophosphate synthase